MPSGSTSNNSTSTEFKVEKCKNIWKNADAVCFDVDSTVIVSEGLDELANYCGKSSQVKAITNAAMGGGLDFRTALSRRLEIISPTMAQMKCFIRDHEFTITKNINKLITLLHSKNIPVYLISGGFYEFIAPVAAKLKIPSEKIYANRLIFYLNGDYAGFDRNQPTSSSNGKGKVIQNLKDINNYKNVIMIGDGITDAEASPPADCFIGFGGNICRNEVKEMSKWFVTDFQELIDEL